MVSRIREILCCFIVLLWGSVLYSQADSVGTYAPKARVLIIPYEEVMFISDLTAEMSAANNLTPDELKSVIRNTVTHIMDQQGEPWFDALMLNPADTLHRRILQKCYYSVRRSYQVIPPSEKSASDVRADSLFKELEITNRFMDKFDRHLSAEIYDAELVPFLWTYFDFDYVLFLNQLDFIFNENEMSSYDTNREVWMMLHYTVTDAKGQPLTGGIARVPFSHELTDISDMAMEVFPMAGKLVWQRIYNTLY